MRAEIAQQTQKIKEGDLLIQVKKILDKFKHRGVLSYRRIHSVGIPCFGKNGRITLRENEDMAGYEDIQVFLSGGDFWAIELKSRTGKQSDEQKARQKELVNLGHDYTIIRTVEELVRELSKRGFNLWISKNWNLK